MNISQEDLNMYFEKIIEPELDTERANKLPILTSQCIKFIVIYRNLVPKEWLLDILKKLTSFLTHESVVIRSYSSCAIEKILCMRDLDTKQLLFTKEIITPLLEDLLRQLNILITESEGLDNYALMSLFRLVTIAKESFLPYAGGFADAMVNFVEKALKDSSTSAYSIYILFETIGYMIFYLTLMYQGNENNDSGAHSKGMLQEYEEKLLPILNKIVEEGRTDIIIYVFQIYAAFVMNSTSTELPPTYATLAKSIMEDPSNTDLDMKYLVPGEIRLIIAILYKYPSYFAEYKDHLFGLLDKVLTELSLEEEAVNLLAAIVEVFELTDLSDEIVQATKSVFTRMFSYKTKTKMKKIPDVFLKSVFVFMARFVLRHGVQPLFDLTDMIQQNIIFNFFEKEGLCISRIGRNEVYRRHVLAAFAMIVTEKESLRGTPAMITLIQGLIENVCPTAKSEAGFRREDANEDLPAEYHEEVTNFERINFMPLYSLENAKSDRLPVIPNYTLHVLQCIQEVVRHESSDFLTQVGSKLTKDTQEHFGRLCEEYEIRFG